MSYKQIILHLRYQNSANVIVRPQAHYIVYKVLNIIYSVCKCNNNDVSQQHKKGCTLGGQPKIFRLLHHAGDLYVKRYFGRRRPSE